jgi:hypothetical protein
MNKPNKPWKKKPEAVNCSKSAQNMFISMNLGAKRLKISCVHLQVCDLKSG